MDFQIHNRLSPALFKTWFLFLDRHIYRYGLPVASHSGKKILYVKCSIWLNVEQAIGDTQWQFWNIARLLHHLHGELLSASNALEEFLQKMTNLLPANYDEPMVTTKASVSEISHWA